MKIEEHDHKHHNEIHGNHGNVDVSFNLPSK